MYSIAFFLYRLSCPITNDTLQEAKIEDVKGEALPPAPQLPPIIPPCGGTGEGLVSYKTTLSGSMIQFICVIQFQEQSTSEGVKGSFSIVYPTVTFQIAFYYNRDVMPTFTCKRFGENVTKIYIKHQEIIQYSQLTLALTAVEDLVPQ